MRLNSTELKAQFQEAYDEDFISDLDTAECENTENYEFLGCTACPANEACKQLTQTGGNGFENFVRNYRELRNEN